MEELDNKIAVKETENDNLPALDDSFEDIATKVIRENDPDKLKNLYSLFNTNQKKKNLLRIIKLNKLMGNIEDQAIERIEKRPDEIGHKELLDYMTVISNQMDRSQKFVDAVDDKPMIQVNNQNHTVNLNIDGVKIDRDSRDKVVDLFDEIMKDLKTAEKSDIIEAETIEVNDKDKGQEGE